MIGKIFGLGATAVFAMAVLISCGDGGDEKSNAAPAPKTAKSNVKSCAYITPEEVAAITGDAVTRTSASGNNCRYHSNSDDGVEVSIHVGDGVKRMLNMRRTVKLMDGIGKQVADKGRVGGDTQALLQEDGSTISLGDEAVWAPASILAVRKGDFYVEVTPPIMHDPANHAGYPLIRKDERRKIAIQVAEKLLSRGAP